MELIDSNEVVTEPVKTTAEQIIENSRISEGMGTNNPLVPKPDKKKAKGRPKLTDAEKEARKKEKEASSGPKIKMPEIDSSVLCLPLCRVMSNAAVSWTKEPKAAMTQAEAMSMADAMGAMLDKYAPGILEKYGAEAIFFLAVGQWSYRVYEIKAEKIKEENQAQSEYDESRTEPGVVDLKR